MPSPLRSGWGWEDEGNGVDEIVSASELAVEIGSVAVAENVPEGVRDDETHSEGFFFFVTTLSNGSDCALLYSLRFAFTILLSCSLGCFFVAFVVGLIATEEGGNTTASTVDIAGGGSFLLLRNFNKDDLF